MRLPAWRGIICAALAFIMANSANAAQAVAPAASPPHPIAIPLSAPTASSSVSPEMLKNLLATLQNEPQRNALIAQIQALLAVEQSKVAASPPPSPGMDFINEVGSHFHDMMSNLGATEGAVIDTPILWSWFEQDMANPGTRRFWLIVSQKLAEILAVALAADWLVGRGNARFRRLTPGPEFDTWYGRALLLLMRLMLDVLPPLAFAGVALIMLPFVHAGAVSTGVTTVVIEAVLTARLLIVTARTILITPREISWRFPPITEETATYLFIWTRRFVNLSIYGFSLAAAATLLRVPDPVTETMNKLVALLLTILAIIFVIQNRLAIAEWLRPRPPIMPTETDVSGDTEAGDTLLPIVQTSRHPLIDFLRHRLADIWHGLAVVYIVGIFIVYVLKIEGGFSFLVRASLLTLVVVLIARLLIQGVKRLSRRGFAISEDLVRRYPTLEARSNRYIPVLTSLAIVAIRLFAIATLFEVWGVSAFSWFNSTLGEQLTGKLVGISVIIGVSFLIWELMNATIDRYLETVDGNGVRIARSARMRTLLPLLRNAAFVMLLIVAGLLLFSELGINIAPLLAGAGVVGLAVGFGSQALVKDVITGLFMVIENTIAVGDLVEFSGHSGIVEAISIRTVKLRDVEGALHTIPFSEISSVKNRSKEFAHQVINVTVARGTDVEKALSVMQRVADAMKEDSDIGALMLTTIDLWGISSFDSNGIQLQGRIKTLPLKNGTVGAEFYRRLDIAFTEAGIALPNSQQIISFGEDVGPLLDRLRPTPRERPNDLPNPI